MANIPTVKVAHEGFDRGFIRINESDYDPDEHTLFEDAPDKEPAADEGEDTASPSFSYEHKGGGYYRILKGGEEIDVVKGKESAEAAVNEHANG